MSLQTNAELLPASAAAIPRPLMQELRTDHAGETGAVMIYRGVLAVARDPALREFALHHLQTESKHLEMIEQVLAPSGRSRLLPLWRLSGWLTGVLPALFGPRAVYATIEAVETFVDRHYVEQVQMIDGWLGTPPGTAGAVPDQVREELKVLRGMLEQCRLDEVAHRDDAAARWTAPAGGMLRLWAAVVGQGSQSAVRVCRHI